MPGICWVGFVVAVDFRLPGCYSSAGHMHTHICSCHECVWLWEVVQVNRLLYSFAHLVVCYTVCENATIVWTGWKLASLVALETNAFALNALSYVYHSALCDMVDRPCFLAKERKNIHSTRTTMHIICARLLMQWRYWAALTIRKYTTVECTKTVNSAHSVHAARIEFEVSMQLWAFRLYKFSRVMLMQKPVCVRFSWCTEIHHVKWQQRWCSSWCWRRN